MLIMEGISIAMLTSPEMRNERNCNSQVERRKRKRDKTFPRHVTEIFPARLRWGADPPSPHPHGGGGVLGAGHRRRDLDIEWK